MIEPDQSQSLNAFSTLESGHIYPFQGSISCLWFSKLSQIFEWPLKRESGALFWFSVSKAKVSGSHCFCDLNSNICIPSWTSEDCSTSTFEDQKLRKLVVLRGFSVKNHYSVLYLPNQNSEKVLKKRNKTRTHSLSLVPPITLSWPNISSWTHNVLFPRGKGYIMWNSTKCSPVLRNLLLQIFEIIKIFKKMDEKSLNHS